MRLWPFGKARDPRATEAAASFLLSGISGLAQLPADNYESYAREGYGRNELVYACINEIATSASEARLRVESKAESEEVEQGPLVELLTAPNPAMSQYDFLAGLHVYLQIAGNVYIYRVRGRAGQTVALYLLRPDRVAVVPSDTGVAGYTYTVDGREYPLAAEDIGHVRLPNPFDDYYGLSPLHVLAKRVNQDFAIADFVRAFFQNAGVPSGLLNVKRKLNSEDEANRIRERWRARFSGGRNWHNLAILDEDATYQQLSVNPDDMAMPDLTSITEARICSAFGVPPILVGAKVGLDRSTFANYAEARASFWHETLLPLYRLIEDALNRFLAPELGPGLRICWDYSEVGALQDDENARWERVGKAWERGLLLRDEARELMGLDPAPAGFGLVYVLPKAWDQFGPDALEPVAPAPAAITEPPAAPALPEPGKGWVLPEFKVTQREQHLLDGLAAVKAQHEPKGAAMLEGYFRRVLNRADSVMGRHYSAAKADTLPFDAGDLLPESLDAELRREWAIQIEAVIAGTWAAVNESGLLGAVAFEAQSSTVLALLDEGGRRIVQINDTTRRAIQESLRLGLERGYSIAQIANGVPGDGFPGVRSLITELYRNRATTIARTEIGTAQIQAAAQRYAASGVTHVTVMDGHEDEPCAGLNGTTQTVEWALANPLGHPRCTRAVLPVVEALVPVGA